MISKEIGGYILAKGKGLLKNNGKRFKHFIITKEVNMNMLFQGYQNNKQQRGYNDNIRYRNDNIL